ncbi:hypothetical protein [Sporosarcina sp. E16_8]|uniref:hypothetical protein n=1 Tax=Sporosarcina sp. E16_8 TaxID=2789295 RepID=UPI001A927041|nr:hypothetical protein [Sporosarcina sp. E16_8]MBO0587106.1 hypothetical protein [Sporosarcina sp. E16_8]
MKKQNNEKGYALLIVLFAIVFITVITAVFMHGALSNATQEKTLDENNLVVVSAESGIDYYTWELKKEYDGDELQRLLEKKVQDAKNGKDNPINYQGIQDFLVSDLMDKIDNKANEMMELGPVRMTDKYYHRLLTKRINEEQLKNGNRKITFTGDVIGEKENGNDKEKKSEELMFQMVFFIPNITPSTDKGEDVIKPTKTCEKLTHITDEKCLYPTNKTSDLESISKMSVVYLDGDYSGYKDLKIQDSYFRMKAYTNGSFLDVQKSKLFVDGNISKYGGSKIHDSSAFIGGDFKDTGTIHFEKSNVLIGKSYLASSSGSKILDSIMQVGTDFNTPNSIIIHKTQLTVGGFMKFNSGGNLESSSLKVGKYLDAPSRLSIRDSEIIIGDYLKLNTGGEFQDTKMKVNSYLDSPQSLKLQKSEVVIGDYLKINTPSEFDHSVLKVGQTFSSPVKIKVGNSIVITKSTKIDVLELQNSTYCTENFEVRDLNMLGSKVFYLNTSNKSNNSIIKLSQKEYNEKCSFTLKIEYPKTPDIQNQESTVVPNLIDWYKYKPITEKVDYK